MYYDADAPGAREEGLGAAPSMARRHRAQPGGSASWHRRSASWWRPASGPALSRSTGPRWWPA